MRPIDADELEKYMTDIMPENTSSAYIKGIIEILTHLINFIRKEMPTIEAEPVRHGRWIDAGINGTVYCSLCRFTDFFAKRDRVMLFRYCPGCGAKMDGGADNGS